MSKRDGNGSTTVNLGNGNPTSAAVTDGDRSGRRMAAPIVNNGTSSGVRDSNYNTKASVCQNVACIGDTVDCAGLEATERLLWEIAATLPRQQQQQQQVGVSRMMDWN